MPKHAIAGGALLALFAGPAAAELSAEGVWADWQRVYAALGTPLTAEAEEYDGSRLLLTGITTEAESSGITTVTRYGTIALIERPDGSIVIDIPSRMEMTISITGEGQDVTQAIVMETEGFDGTIREVGGARVYDMDAARVAYLFEDATGETPAEVALTMTALDSTYTSVTQGDLVNFEQEVDAADLSLVVSAEDPSGEEGGSFDMTYRLDALDSTFSGGIDLASVPETAALSGMGITFDGEAAHAGSTTSVAVDSADGPFSLEGTSDGGRIAFGLTADALSYLISSTGAEMQARTAAFPLPISLSMSELTTSFALPVGVSDDPKPFAMLLSMADLTVDETLWGLFDPTGQLPRDAATLLIDLEGTALMRADIFGDPEAVAALGGPPGEVRTLDLKEILVSLAGAELRGDGALEFPEVGLGATPQPVGTVNLALDGGLGLADRLVALGFLPAEQVAFAKGMAGMVAQTVGDDQLRSVIEFTEDGGIVANGMPLQ